jgi:hypothetical protein
VGVNFFQRHPAKPAEEIEPPPVEPALLPKEKVTRATNTVEPIHVNDAQYDLLTRALRPGVAPVLKDLKIDVTEPSGPGVVDEAGQPHPANPRVVSPERPPGTPIV